ncbi:hypothetical protein K493DRAFT_19215 [Basidiobolus meristosporus CBS 931.73]|uniref:Citrate transporter-like domain-containing protein n=1 Tax=Basidiobolus meristosporus CBS 931.73 TaxID=1314790 RepID=A0A1Y1YET6_9FUNG|nr:hypothetical protein K493DRAFT_19215 [Basidiobolus meristosporus CBS 931.73]|eukprot:ORX96517.1 hypothetical protein K493DRAFT_19215 [Basidiobolus meristosporus CBS 931.73]
MSSFYGHEGLVEARIIPRLDYSSYKTYLVILVCAVSLLSFVRTRSGLNINRSVISLLSGGIMVVFDVITPGEAYSSLHGSSLLLLFAFMIIITKFNDKGFIFYFRQLLLWGSPTPKALMLRLSLLSGVLGFFFMTDISAVYISTVVMTLCEDYGLDIEPFAVAAVTASNIGSTACVIGSMNNVLAHEMSPGLDFLPFFLRMSIPAILGLLVNSIFLWIYYRRSLSQARLSASSHAEHNYIAVDSPEFYKIAEEYAKAAQNRNTLYIDEGNSSHSTGPISITISNTAPEVDENSRLLSHPLPVYCDILSTSPESISSYEYANTPPSTPVDPQAIRVSIPGVCPPSPPPSLSIPAAGFYTSSGRSSLRLSPVRKKHGIFFDKTITDFLESWRTHYRTIITVLAIVFMYLSLAFGDRVGWTALIVALIIVLVDNRREPNDLFADLDFPTIAYYFGLFVMIRGIEETPIVEDIWTFLSGKLATISSPVALVVFFAGFVAFLTMVLTPVPTLLILLPLLEDMVVKVYGQRLVWLLVWCIAISSNLLPTGSVSGLAMRETMKISLVEGIRSRFDSTRFWLKYSLWTTPIIMAIGIAIIADQ